METQVLHLRLEMESYKTLQRVAGKCGLSANALGVILLRAGVQAVANNDDRLPLPLELGVKAEPVLTDEPRSTKALGRR
jgi:hypothetical protein